MTVHLSPPPTPALADALALWRARYPKFAAALDAGEPPVKALRYLGLALWQDRAIDEAVAVLGAAAALAPGDPALLADLGGALSAAGRKSEALPAYIASIEADSSRPLVWLAVAGLCNEIGDKTTAEQAYRAALELDPDLAEASAALGLLYLENRRFEDGARLLRTAVERGVATVAIHACFGQTLFQLGEFSEAATALEHAARALPDSPAIVRKFALARLVETALMNSSEQALDAYRIAAGRHAEEETKALRSAFQTLCGFGRRDAALRLGEAILRSAPDDPVIPFHLDALRGRPHARASRGYVAACFDKYAADFDRHLVETLGYRLPEKLPPLLAETGRAFARILDLGCGTGLAAEALAAFGAHVTGVDLSPRMLDKARAHGVYARLVEEDAVDFLAQTGECFDLVVALDMLIYLGDLAALFAGVAARLAPSGLFVLSFETGAGADYALAPSGRFAHEPAYVESLWTADFVCRVCEPTTIRLEANRPVAGRLVLLERK
jgi:predicted TPR repeat methyltransferase